MHNQGTDYCWFWVLIIGTSSTDFSLALFQFHCDPSYIFKQFINKLYSHGHSKYMTITIKQLITIKQYNENNHMWFTGKIIEIQYFDIVWGLFVR